MTEAETQKLVTVMVTAFPSTFARMTREQQSEFMAIYRRMLGDLDYAVANAAFERLLATSRFLPTIAEIRDVALAISAGEAKAGGEAWGSVLRAMTQQGAYRVPGEDFEFRDPVVLECVKSMGWRELCLSENQVADRARFIELYEQLQHRSRRLQLSDGLPAMQRLRAQQEAKRLESSGAVQLGKLLPFKSEEP